MKIKEENFDKFLMVSPFGEIDAVTSTELEESLTKGVSGGKDRIILDLAEVPYISSAGLRVFLKITKLIYGKGKFVLSRPQPNIRDLINMAGLNNFIKIFDNLDDAKKEINQ
jgi:anti-sigma B factor antagonist